MSNEGGDAGVVKGGSPVGADRPHCSLLIARCLLPLLIVAAVAAAFRFYRLDVLPPGLFFDEAVYGVDAAGIARGERFPLMLEVDGIKGRTREPLFVYLAAGLFALPVRACWRCAPRGADRHRDGRSVLPALRARRRVAHRLGARR